MYLNALKTKTIEGI